jgi:hypothetical protein
VPCKGPHTSGGRGLGQKECTYIQQIVNAEKQNGMNKAIPSWRIYSFLLFPAKKCLIKKSHTNVLVTMHFMEPQGLLVPEKVAKWCVL